MPILKLILEYPDERATVNSIRIYLDSYFRKLSPKNNFAD